MSQAPPATRDGHLNTHTLAYTPTATHPPKRANPPAPAPAAREWAPVFVDPTGIRRRWLRVAGFVTTAGCLLYGVILVISLIWSPITPDTPGTSGSAARPSMSQPVPSADRPVKEAGGS